MIWFQTGVAERDHSVCRKCDWSEFYCDAEEAILMNIPESQGREIEICMFVDSDHAENKTYCRLRSGFLIYVNITLVQQFSKKQSTVETLVFVAEFVVMK